MDVDYEDIVGSQEFVSTALMESKYFQQTEKEKMASQRIVVKIRRSAKTMRHLSDKQKENGSVATPSWLFEKLNDFYFFNHDPCPLIADRDGLSPIEQAADAELYIFFYFLKCIFF